MITITFITGLLLPALLYALLGTGAITLTLLNLIGVLLLSALSVSVVIAIAALSKAVK
jgi:predicted small integral membrane protein